MKRVFERILIIMFENQYREYVMANPYMLGLARQGIDLSNYSGVMHPSQTNYIASIAGELCNVTSDDWPGLLPQRTIVDLIEEAPGDLQWKAYMDGYRPAKTPWTPDLAPQDDYPYVIKHNPFASFERIVRDESRWQRIVSETQFFKDVLNNDLPHYAWFTPDMWNDGHYLDGTEEEPEERAPALVDQLAAWLEDFFTALRFPGPDSLLPRGTLVVVTFDESDFLKAFAAGDKYTYDGPNQVYTVLLGDMITPRVEDGAYNHYNLLKTIEVNFGLGDLGKNDAAAAPMHFLFGQEFDWGSPQPTPIETHEYAASAGLGRILHTVVCYADGGLAHTTFNGETWGVPRDMDLEATGPMAMACRDDQLVLIYQAEESALLAASYDVQTGWTQEPEPVGQISGACAICSFADDSELMAVWVGPDGAILSRRRDPGGWASETVDTGHRTNGAVALAALGPSLFLVFQDPDSDRLLAVTYSTADFNTTNVATTAYSGPWDNAVLDRWSPSAIPVGRFGVAAFAGTPDELEPVTVPIESGAPIALVELEGTLHLLHTGVANRQLITERFSVPGILTPGLPISYKASDEETTSNGYGTLAEAGWTRSEPVDHTWVGEGGALSAARVEDAIVLLCQPEAGDPLEMWIAGYVDE